MDNYQAIWFSNVAEMVERCVTVDGFDSTYRASGESPYFGIASGFAK